MIHFKNVTKRFKKTVAVDNLDLVIPKGKTVALIGANGSGKTTIMRMIATLIAPTQGEIYVNGLNAKKYVGEVRREIGLMLGGDVALMKRFSARENILFYAGMQGMEKMEAEKRMLELSNQLQMCEYLERRVETFSRGMRQKVLLAQTLIHDPSILLLDEPSTGLDIFATMEIQSLIKECNKMGKTILISSHNMSEVKALCNYFIIIDKGKLLFIGDTVQMQEKCGTADIGLAFTKLITEQKEEE